MTIAAYEAMNEAFASKSIQRCDRAVLQEYLVLLCSRHEVNSYIQHRDIIRGITINQILMQRHIDSLNEQNAKTQRLVIALTLASLIGTGAQVWYAAKADKTPEAIAPAIATQPQTSAPQLVAPSQAKLPAPGQPIKKAP